MTQKEYIRKLRTRLAFVVSENERNDIIADIEEIFSDSMADGKSEEQICLSLGSPEETAKNILSEKGISSAGRIIKSVIFAVIAIAAVYFPLINAFGNTFAAIIPSVLLIVMLSAESIMQKDTAVRNMSAVGVISCILSMINVFLFSKLADSVIRSDEAALFPLGAAITAVTALSLILAVISARPKLYAFAAGAAASLCIIGLQIYAAFHIADKISPEFDIDQITFRTKYVNIFIMTLFASAGALLVISALCRDKAFLFRICAALGALVLFGSERYILRTIDPTAADSSVIGYIPTSLWTAVCAALIFSAAVTVLSGIRKAKKNG